MYAWITLSICRVQAKKVYREHKNCSVCDAVLLYSVHFSCSICSIWLGFQLRSAPFGLVPIILLHTPWMCSVSVLFLRLFLFTMSHFFFSFWSAFTYLWITLLQKDEYRFQFGLMKWNALQVASSLPNPSYSPLYISYL